MTKGKFLGRADILQAADLTIEEVPVPEWGGLVRVRTLTAMERDQFENDVLIEKGKRMRVELRNIRAKLVALTVVDEAGVALFSETDVQALGQKNAAAMSRVYDVAARLAGISDEDVEVLAKN